MSKCRRYRADAWNGLRVDSGRALIVNGTKLLFTKGIGNGTGLPYNNWLGGYQALQGAFFPVNNQWDGVPYTPYAANPLTRNHDNSYTAGGAENCEFFPHAHAAFDATAAPLAIGQTLLHAVCAAHGAAYQHGSTPHYLVTVSALSLDQERGAVVVVPSNPNSFQQHQHQHQHQNQ